MGSRVYQANPVAAPSGPLPSQSQQGYEKLLSDIDKDVREERTHTLKRFDELELRQKISDESAGLTDKIWRTFENFTVDDVRAEFPGNLTRQTEDAYADLLLGEKILATLDCYIRVRARSRCYLFCCCIFTLGLYLFWLACCSCIRSRRMSQTRITIGVTNMGRVVYWHCDKKSMEDTCSIQNVKEENLAQTYAKYIPVKNVNMVQLRYKKTILGRPLCHLRIFTGRLPDVAVPMDDLVTISSPGFVINTDDFRRRMQPVALQDPPEDCFIKYGELVLQAYFLFLLVYDFAILVKDMFDRSIIGVIKFIMLVFQNIMTGYKLAVYGRPDVFGTNAATDRCVDLFVPSHDEFTRDEDGKRDPRGVYDKVVLFNRILLEARASKVALPNSAPTPYNYFEHVDDPEDKLTLLSKVSLAVRPGCENGVPHPSEDEETGPVPVKEPSKPLPKKVLRVNIDVDEVPMAEGEEVLDAFGVERSMTASDWARTIVTFGFYYLLYLRLEFQYKRAVIITNKRVIRVLRAGGSKSLIPVFSNVVYDFDMTWFILEGVSAGIVSNFERTFQAQCQTGAGALAITLHKPKLVPWSSQILDPDYRNRCMDFLFKLSGGEAALALQDPKVIGGPTLESVADQRYKLGMLETVPGEVVLCFHKNEGVKSMKPCGVCTEYCCCGMFPVYHEGQVTITSHRMLVYVSPNNRPWCCPRMAVEDHKWMWLPLANPTAFQGWSLTGSVVDRNVRCCQDCFWKRNKQSSVSFNVMALNNVPIHIKSLVKGDNIGRLEGQDMKRLRVVMGGVMAGQHMTR